jgi:putative glycerol-1-phosphate prenyltransferase
LIESTGVWSSLLEIKSRRGAGYLTLLDPDRLSIEELELRADRCIEAGADAILIGSSLMLSSGYSECFKRIKSRTDLPVICFPGSTSQVTSSADAILFLSMISGRNPELLIGEHVRAAPIIKEYGIEPISTGYILVESGMVTSVEFMSQTKPLPRTKTDIAMAHALAAEYLGMKAIYLETGSGSNESVPLKMISDVSNYVSLPIIVGGGIRDDILAREIVEAGASFVVTGSLVEDDSARLAEVSAAIHVNE